MFNVRLGLYTDHGMQRIRNAASVLAKLPIHINDRRMTIEELVAWLTYVVSRYGVKFAVVDYLQLIKPSGGNSHSRNEQVLEWSARIKEASKRLNLVTLVLSQLSRGGDRIVTKTPAPPTLESFRDSGGIEQDADCAMLLYKEPDTDALEFFGDSDWRMETCVAKNRVGPTGTRPVRFVRRRQVFESVDGYEDRKKRESAPQGE
jgi:replicative DNA helicase